MRTETTLPSHFEVFHHTLFDLIVVLYHIYEVVVVLELWLNVHTLSLVSRRHLIHGLEVLKGHCHVIWGFLQAFYDW